MYAPYDKETAPVQDRIAWALCQIIDDDAPMRWTRYRFAAGCIAKNPELMADLKAYIEKPDMQALVDGIGAKMQREREATHLTLGALIAALQAMPADAAVANLRDPASYRGYYCDLYFERHEGTRPAAELLAECNGAMGQVFTGYKGGDYMMGALTPLWISTYGHASGMKIIAVRASGEVETAQDD